MNSQWLSCDRLWRDRGGMLAGLLIMRADGRAYWRWPVYSAMVMALGVVLWSLLRKHVFPPQWILLHGGALYFSALTLYVLLGLGAGVLLGRSRAAPLSDKGEFIQRRAKREPQGRLRRRHGGAFLVGLGRNRSCK